MICIYSILLFLNIHVDIHADIHVDYPRGNSRGYFQQGTYIDVVSGPVEINFVPKCANNVPYRAKTVSKLY